MVQVWPPNVLILLLILNAPLVHISDDALLHTLQATHGISHTHGEVDFLVWREHVLHGGRIDGIGTNILTSYVRDFHVIQQWVINFVSSSVTDVVNEAVRVQADDLGSPKSCRFIYADDLTTHDSSISGRSRGRDIT